MTSTIHQQVQAIADSAARLREVVGHPLPGLDASMYLRPVADGCAILSVDPLRRPLQGVMRRWGKDSELQTWRTARDHELAKRDQQPNRDSLEKSLQAQLIRDAMHHHGWMEMLSAACAERPRLRFLADDLTLRVGDDQTVCDLIAVRWQDDVGIPIVIELKSARHLRRLTKHVRAAAALMNEHVAAFQHLTASCWGSTARLSPATESWIMWPVADPDHHGDLDPWAERCRTAGVRLVTYTGKPGESFVLTAAAIAI